MLASNFNDIANQFYSASLKYSSAIEPYAVKLFVGLLLVDILVTWIQFTAEGELDGGYFLADSSSKCSRAALFTS